MHAYEHGHRPQGSPPTRDEHRVLERNRRRPLTDDATGAHMHTWARRKTVAVSPDILRRAGQPTLGERTPEQAGLIIAAKIIAHVLGITNGEANRMIREAAA